MAERKIQASTPVSLINGQIEQSKIELEQAQRKGDLNLASQVYHGRLPELQNKLVAAEKALREKPGNRLLPKKSPMRSVQVVAAWTHIPVSRMLEGERYSSTWSSLQQRIIGQSAAVKAVANAVRRSRSGLQDPNRPIGLLFSSALRAWARPRPPRALAGIPVR